MSLSGVCASRKSSPRTEERAVEVEGPQSHGHSLWTLWPLALGEGGQQKVARDGTRKAFCWQLAGPICQTRQGLPALEI